MTPNESSRHDWRRVGGAVVVFALAYLAIASSTTLWDRDEPRFARAAVEMLQGGDWLVPHFNGELRLHKPSGVYWPMAASIHLFGIHEVAVRLPSILGMLIAGIATYGIGCLITTRNAAWWAMVMFLSAGLVIYMGTASTADGQLIGMMTLATWMGIDCVLKKPRWSRFIVMALALAAALLIKGPVGLIAWLSVLLMACFVPGARRCGRIWAGLVFSLIVSCALFAWWAIPADAATNGQFFSEGFKEHVLQRGTTAREGHGGEGWQYFALLPIYIPVIIGCFSPWIIHLPAGFSALVRKHIGTPATRILLWCWMLPAFVIFSLYATKLPHYVLPIFPALALLCAMTMQAHADDQLSEKDRDWLRGGIWFFGPVAVGAIVTLGGLGWFIGWTDFAWRGLIVAVVLAVMMFIAVRHQLAERLHRASTTLLTGLLIILALVMSFVMPVVERDVKIGPQLAAAIRARCPQPVPVVWYGYAEPSFVFYLDQPVDMPIRDLPISKHADITNWISQPGPSVLVIARKYLSAIEAEVGPLDLEPIVERSAINYSSGAAPMSVVVLGRNLPEFQASH